MHGRSFAGKWCILTLCLFILGTASFANSATVTTDTTDYPPGGLVTITGAGFSSGEQVMVQVTHADGSPSTGLGHDPWYVSAGSGGGFVTYWIVPYDDNLGEQLLVTATGQSSTLVATATFWDNIQINLDQLQNGTLSVTPEWANGNIDPAKYTQLLAQAYNAIKSANPNVAVISGALAVKLPGADNWQTFPAGATFTVEANQRFDLRVVADTAYLCKYE